MQFGSQLLLIDLRDEESFKKGHVRSAINIPWTAMAGRDLDAIEDELPPRFRRRRTNCVYAYDEVSPWMCLVCCKTRFHSVPRSFALCRKGKREKKKVMVAARTPGRLLPTLWFFH